MKTTILSLAAGLLAGSLLTCTANAGSLAFGPGYSSDFKISSTERGYVVGVYGLTSSNFTKRSDGFRAFTHSSIVDREKGSGSDALDHEMCTDYSFADIFVWTGWSKTVGYADEDIFGDDLMNDVDAAWSAYNEAWKGIDTADCYEYIPFDDTLPATLKSSMSDATGLMAFGVMFFDYTWYGEEYDAIGHSVVCCGYSYDTTKQPSDPTYLKGLFVIDPDNDRESTLWSRALKPDTITYCPVSWDEDAECYAIKGIFGAVGYFSEDYGGGEFIRTGNTVTRKAYVESSSSSNGSGSSTISQIYGKSRTIKSFYMSYTTNEERESEDFDERFEDPIEGLATIQFKKATSAGKVKFRVKLSPFFGTATSVVKTAIPDSDGRIETSITLNGFGTFTFYAGLDDDGEFECWGETEDETYFFGDNEYIGGSCNGNNMWFGFDPSKMPTFKNKDLVEELLPNDYYFSVTDDGTWDTGTKPKMGFVQVGDSDDYDTIYGNGWAIYGLDDASKPNYSGLKFKYNASTGKLQAKFKVYYTNANYTNSKPKMLTKTVKVRAIVGEDGYWGSGTAAMTVGKKTYTWPVFVAIPEDDDDEDDADYDDDDDVDTASDSLSSVDWSYYSNLAANDADAQAVVEKWKVIASKANTSATEYSMSDFITEYYKALNQEKKTAFQDSSTFASLPSNVQALFNSAFPGLASGN